MFELGNDRIEAFRRDGFVLVDNLIDEATAEALKLSFGRMFRGSFETGIRPDEVNWQQGESDPSLTRQICNGWKGDRTVAATVLREDIGRACALLAGWPGARVKVDNLLWKPAGTRPLGMHQDCAYLDWISPNEMTSCWIALDDTTAEGGTMELVRGSHRWAAATPIARFHGPDDYRREMRRAAAAEGIGAPEIVPVVVKKGGGSFHHGRTWHGSGPNGSARARRSLVIHCLSSEARYVPEKIATGTGPIYGRYMPRDGGTAMDDNDFPILWGAAGTRSAWIESYLAAPLDGAGGGR